MFIRDNIVCSKVDELSRCNDNIESCVAKVSLDDSYMIIVGIYRPHDLHPSFFTEELQNIIESEVIKTSKLTVVVEISTSIF